jgi:hypothetical protein
MPDRLTAVRATRHPFFDTWKRKLFIDKRQLSTTIAGETAGRTGALIASPEPRTRGSSNRVPRLEAKNEVLATGRS